jgi:hypothetical protein
MLRFWPGAIIIRTAGSESVEPRPESFLEMA